MIPAFLRAAAFAAALLVAGCALEADAGPLRSEERVVAAFDRVAVDGRTDVTIRRGPRQTLALRGGARLLDDVSTTVDGRTLEIDRVGMDGAPLEVAITLPRLRAVDADSAGEIELLGIDSEALELRSDGAGELTASGRVGTLTATLGGVGKLQLARLTARRADVRVDGVGSAEVNVTGELAAVVTGVGAVEYHGDALVRADVRGLGDVHHVDR